MGRTELSLEERYSNRTLLWRRWSFHRICSLGISHGRWCHDPLVDNPQTDSLVLLPIYLLLIWLYARLFLLPTNLLPDCTRCVAIIKWCVRFTRYFKPNPHGGCIGISWYALHTAQRNPRSLIKQSVNGDIISRGPLLVVPLLL